VVRVKIDLKEIYAPDLVILDTGFSMEQLQDKKQQYAKVTQTYRNSGVIKTISHPSSKNLSGIPFIRNTRSGKNLEE
jgi:hypothetical protein